jgi:hypothetical protein
MNPDKIPFTSHSGHREESIAGTVSRPTGLKARFNSAAPPPIQVEAGLWTGSTFRSAPPTRRT